MHKGNLYPFMVHKFTLLIPYKAYAIRVLLVLASLMNFVLLELLVVNSIQCTSCYKISKTKQSIMLLGNDSRTFSYMF